MSKYSKKHYVAQPSIAVMLMVGCFGQSVKAQDDDNSTIMFEEIIVTAQKRTENLQDVPLSVTALDSLTLKETGADDILDIVAMIPGAGSAINNPSEQTLSIRGVAGGSEGPATDTSVSVLIDGEVISRSFMYASAFYDMERVEVLRGPQGTTYGRNATGGIVHFISKKPTQEPSGSLKVGYGNLNRLKAEGYINGGISDKISARLSLYYDESDGYTDDAISGEDLDTRQTFSGRLQFLIDPSDQFSVHLRAHYSKDDHGSPRPRRSYDPSLPFFIEPITDFPLLDDSLDPYEASNNEDTFYEREIYGVSADIYWEFGGFSLKSITAYRHGDDDIRNDLFGTRSRLVVQNSSNDSDVFNQELRFDNSPSADGLFWTIGLFYLNEDSNRLEHKEALYALPNLGDALGTDQVFDEYNTTNAYGVFGETAIDLTDTLRLTLGGRYSRDKKDFTVDHTATGFAADVFIEPDSLPTVAGSASDKWSAFTGRASLDYNITDDVMVYATISQGYLSGGFNGEPVNAEALMTSFDKEKLTNIEAGVRASSADRRFIVNATTFLMSYDDIQVPDFLPSGTSIVDNAGEADIRGVEIDFLLRPNSIFSLSGAFGYIDSEMKQHPNAEFIGMKLAEVPEWTIALSGTVDIPLFEDKGDLRLRVDYRNRGTILDGLMVDDGSTFFKQNRRPGVGKVDARLTWADLDDRFEVSVWGRNLTNKVEQSGIGPVVGLYEQRTVTYHPPREYGISVAVNF